MEPFPGRTRHSFHCRHPEAVISLARLRPEFYGSLPDDTIFLQRAVKEAVRELGRKCGMGHCRNPRCTMFFTNSPHDTGMKGPDFGACGEKMYRGTPG